MTKLLVTIVLTVLVLGGCIFAMGGKVIPEIGNAGDTVKTWISEAF